MDEILRKNIERLYFNGELSDDGLQNAVYNKWITQEQADVIKDNRGVV